MLQEAPAARQNIGPDSKEGEAAPSKYTVTDSGDTNKVIFHQDSTILNVT